MLDFLKEAQITSNAPAAASSSAPAGSQTNNVGPQDTPHNLSGLLLPVQTMAELL